MNYAIEMLNITKTFPGIKANDNVTLQVKKGEIHALLGENGAGKSTLMSILFGLYKPNSGTIKINGVEQKNLNPKVANSLGIGMVHQHFKLVGQFTALENITLGIDEVKGLNKLDYKGALEKITNIMKKYNMEVDLHKKVCEMSVGMQQRVEILKVLFRDNDVIILDEPTAVLAPQQINALLETLKSLSKNGKTIIFISHKLKEILAVSDSCSVLRKGKSMGSVITKDSTGKELTELMVGRTINFVLDKKEVNDKQSILSVKGLKLNENLKEINFDLYKGEILAIAGIEGNGQKQLVEAITGLENFDCSIMFIDKEINNMSIKERSKMGISHIPEDRQKDGLLLNESVMMSTILHQYDSTFCKKGFLDYSKIFQYTENIIKKYDVRVGKGMSTIVRSMSGGNQQKLIVGRELEREPKLLIAVQPTRGVDIGAINSIYKMLIDYRDSGGAVLLVSLELDEILDLSDRILVLYNNEIVANKITSKTNAKELGLYMVGSQGGATDGYYEKAN